MRIFKTLSVVIFLVYSLTLLANEKVVCVITSDIDSNSANITVDLDQENHRIKHFYQDRFVNSQMVERIEIKEESLKEGVVLDRDGRYITVRIQSDTFDFEHGGTLNIDTLYSGVSGKRVEYVMDMIMDDNGPVLEKNNQPFTKMLFISNRSIFFGVIGIKDIMFKD